MSGAGSAAVFGAGSGAVLLVLVVSDSWVAACAGTAVSVSRATADAVALRTVLETIRFSPVFLCLRDRSQSGEATFSRPVTSPQLTHSWSFADH